ncbi:winged helix-turn-helix transcriptional regulator [Streptosporangium sp. NPDC006013]|uniref:winged helix-turn-helix transcriptional regulator n=1 Tax=Streptosporangium sp. NPDC006013 TaxID=3155596 RepID=UPI0033BA48A9
MTMPLMSLRSGRVWEPLRGITPKVLTQTLRAMERGGLVIRAAYDENPPRVKYELTAPGRRRRGAAARRSLG